MLIISSASSSCSGGDDDPQPTVYPEENFLNPFLTNSGMTSISTVINTVPAEFGVQFRPKVKGVLKVLKVKFPAASSTKVVTVWDVSAQNAIAAETFVNIAADVEQVKDITDIPLQKDKEYIISVYSDDFYQHSKPSGMITFPINVGNIEVTGLKLNVGSSAYPGGTWTPYFGDIDFVFQQTP